MIDFIALAIIYVSLAYFINCRINTLLAYFQQEEYNNARFISAFFRVRLFDVKATLLFLTIYISISITSLNSLSVFLLSLPFIIFTIFENKYVFKKPLVKTERVKRLRNLSLFILLLASQLIFLDYLYAILILHIAPVVLIISNIFLSPLQEKINSKFIMAATNKLNSSDVIKVGITGSFGKTTVKHMLGELMEVDAPTFYSKGSINTILGLTRHIRKRLQPIHKYFLAEMGAYKIGSIESLCKFIQPSYGIVTAVGHAHTERFGSIESIASAKSELARWICYHGKTILITEAVLAHKPFKELRNQFKEKFCIVGSTDECDIKILHSYVEGTVRKIKLSIDKENRQIKEFEIPLLGEHNVINIALTIGLVYSIEPSLIDKMAIATKELSQVPHRLQKKLTLGQPLILDDAYNSNEQGFRNAVQVMNQIASQQSGKAILVTPGIAELGELHEPVHSSLANYCNELCDVIYVVNSDRIESFTQNLDNRRLTVIEVKSFKDAYSHISKAGYSENDVILYENDLPDLLEERRLL